MKTFNVNMYNSSKETAHLLSSKNQRATFESMPGFKDGKVIRIGDKELD